MHPADARPSVNESELGGLEGKPPLEVILC
jgi:hypothetical protein